MRARAFADLSQLSDPDFFQEISEGLQLIARNVGAIDADSRTLVEADRGRGARILHAFAAEEAGKYLILLDAVRCPRVPPERFVAQLHKANHQASMISVRLESSCARCCASAVVALFEEITAAHASRKRIQQVRSLPGQPILSKI